MIRRPFLPSVASLPLFVGALLSLGCAQEIPPRPLPPLEKQAEIPPWFPEQPWNERRGDERTYFFGKVVFDTARHTIRPESKKVLEQLLAWLQANPDISRIRLEGHTDDRAGDEYNQALSERRATAVADWLVDNGLDHNRLLAVAFGETRPMATNDNALGRQENRRTAFYVAEVSGRRYRGEDPTNGGLVITILSKEERDAMKRKAEIPKYVPPKVNPERDVFKPYPPTGDPAILKDKILSGDQQHPDAVEEGDEGGGFKPLNQ